MTDTAVEVTGLCKQYPRGGPAPVSFNFREDLVRASLSLLRRSKPKTEMFWALKDIDLRINEGEAVAIIGQNGAGKSTLLKVLSRITAPTSGSVMYRGRVASLLEVGTGFHRELTGRENIFLNGSILGMKRAEIARKFDEIVAFAEIADFIDTPVKFYSSGMYVRLAFAVAAHLESDVLVVDEVLAVGDAGFQKKCLGTMEQVTHAGRTVLFVSHNMGAVQKLCPRAVWLDQGRLRHDGPSGEVIGHYMAEVFGGTAVKHFPLRPESRAQFTKVRVLDHREQERAHISAGTDPIIELSFTLREAVQGAHVACIVTTTDGVHLFSTADTDSAPSLFERRAPGNYVARVRLPMRDFNIGSYYVSVGIGIPGVESFDRQDAVTFSVVEGDDFGAVKEGGRRQGIMLVSAPWNYV